MSDKKTVVITSAVRTAVGSLSGTLKNIPAYKLGSSVISNAIKKSNLKTSDVNEVIMGQVLTGGAGQNPARQASMDSGIPKETPSYVVNQVCGSGLRSIASGFQSILSNSSEIVVAGGQESMSQAPHVAHLRNGKKLGDTDLIDSMIKDGLWDAFNGYHMGVTAENVAQKFQVTRKDQDKFAFESQTKALKAQKENKFNDEIVPFTIELKKGRASDEVVGQIQRYMGYVQTEVAMAHQQVKGLIIALQDDLRIKRALSINPDINFARYEISFELIDTTGVLPPKPLGRHRLIP